MSYNLSSKQSLNENLEYFDVNRVVHYKPSKWLHLIKTKQLQEPLWSIRDITKLLGEFYYGVDDTTVISLISKNKITDGNFLVCRSMKKEDKEDLIVNGEVLIYKDYQYNVWSYGGILNYKQGLSVRDASLASNVKYITHRLHIPQIIFDILWEEGLINMVVEFTLYNKPVGIHNQPLLIWELRRY